MVHAENPKSIYISPATKAERTQRKQKPVTLFSFYIPVYKDWVGNSPFIPLLDLSPLLPLLSVALIVHIKIGSIQCE
jgi:hypothetical protein